MLKDRVKPPLWKDFRASKKEGHMRVLRIPYFAVDDHMRAEHTILPVIPPQAPRQLVDGGAPSVIRMDTLQDIVQRERTKKIE